MVYSALFLNFFLVGSITPLVPRLAKDHGMSDYDRSIILSAKSFAHMAASPIVAYLAMRISTKLIFCFGVFCICGAFTGIAFSTTMTGFVVSRAVQGVGISSIMVAGMSILVLVVPEQKRGKYTSWAYSALGHSTLISPLLSGLMYDRIGQLWTFLIPAIATLFAAISSLVVFRKLSLSVTDTESEPESVNIFQSVVAILRYPGAFVGLAGIFSAGMTFGCFESTIPAILADQLDVIQANLMWSIGALVFTIAAPVLGILIDKVGAYRVFVSGLFLYAIFYPLMSTIAVNLGGLGAIIAIVVAIEAVLEVSVYPVMAAVVDAQKPLATLTIAYAMNEVFIQGGFAIGDILGVALYLWKGLLGIGAIMGAWDGLLGICCVVVLHRSKVYVVKPPHTDELI